MLELNTHYMNRSSCKLSIHRFHGARYERFSDFTAARDAWSHANKVGNIGSAEGLSASETLSERGRVLADHEVYYVVVKGARPGVYFGR